MMPAIESSGDKASAVEAQHSCNTLCDRRERLEITLEGRVSCTSWCSGFSNAVASGRSRFGSAETQEAGPGARRQSKTSILSLKHAVRLARVLF